MARGRFPTHRRAHSLRLLCCACLLLCGFTHGSTANSNAAVGSDSTGSGSGGARSSSGSGAVHPRLEINQLMGSPAHAKQRDLFLWALRRQQGRQPTHPASFYQLMGIHGAPFPPYQGLTHPSFQCNGTRQYCGYCHHGDVLFPTWHRAYLALLEAHLQRDAAAAAGQFARVQPGQAGAWRAAAQALRVPYWDFASDATGGSGVPPFFVQERVRVLSPHTGRPTRMPNPFRQFRFPADTGLPTDESPRFSRRGTLTLRWPAPPGGPGGSNISALNASVLQHSVDRWRQGVRDVLAETDWYCFSNHEAPLKDRRCAPLASLEFVHDLLHRGLGGPGGHLTYTRISAFDPLFFLLHVSTDRLLAMWQLAHPRTWVPRHTAAMGTRVVPEGSEIDAATPLVPFFRYGPRLPPAAGTWDPGAFYTSADVRDWRALGYTYADVEQWRGMKPAHALRKMLAAYRPKN